MPIDRALFFQTHTKFLRDKLLTWRNGLRLEGKKLIFTNGVFDILHSGHIMYLEKAHEFGNVLFVGLNSDESVRRIKGPNRPLSPQQDRAEVLGALRAVDALAIFEEDTPLELIKLVLPDVLIKGADYTRASIVGADVVEAHGGHVLTVPLSEGRSTSGIVEKILERYK